MAIAVSNPRFAVNIRGTTARTHFKSRKRIVSKKDIRRGIRFVLQ